MLRLVRILLLAASLALTGCTTLTSARPLSPGEHEVGLTVGGPMLQAFGGAIPLPVATVQARSGLTLLADRPLELNYGLDLTALPYGVFQVHLGAAWLIQDQHGAAPALAVTNRVFFASNFLGAPGKPGAEVEAWGADQIELDVSWELKGQLIYVGLAQYFDFRNPTLTLTPALGAVFDPAPAKPTGVRLHLEARWFAINQQSRTDFVHWVPGGAGSLGITIGVSYMFGPKAKGGAS